MRAREGWGQVLYLNVSDDLPSKKSSLRKIFGSNLSLKNKEIRFVPTTPYAALRAARENFVENELCTTIVGREGLEPSSLAAIAPKAIVSADFTTCP